MERRKEKHLLRRNLLEVMALGLAAPVLIIPAMLIILNADRLGIWWLPLLLLYLLPFTTRQLFMVQRRERNRIRTLVGEEMYFTIYPRDLKKALRSARKEGVPPERAETLALYADTVHGALSTDPAVREKQQEKEKKLQFALDLFELGVIDREELLLRMQTK